MSTVNKNKMQGIKVHTKRTEGEGVGGVNGDENSWLFFKQKDSEFLVKSNRNNCFSN